MAKVLIVDDEKSINDLVLMNLSLVGYTCFQAFDGKQAIDAINKYKPDIILLDVMIPYRDGFSLIEDKALSGIPVIFLTAKDSVADKVRGLRLGADDYITKPFEAVELLARVEAVLRRTQKSHIQQEFVIGDAVVNIAERKAWLSETEVELTNREFELLEVLIKNRNIALSRQKLLDLVWGYDYVGDTRTVDVHITKLRKKLKLENYIKTVYKLGYRLEV